MSRRDLGTSIRRRGRTVDKSAMEQMLRRERAMRKRRRKQKSISLAAAVSKNVIALATSLHGIGSVDSGRNITKESGRYGTGMASAKRVFASAD